MHIIGEVITNLNRNRVMTITSIFTVFFMLVLVGVFGLLLLNISYNSEFMDSMLEIRVSLVPGTDEYRENLVREAITEDARINYLMIETNEEAYQNAIEDELFDVKTLEDMGPEVFPTSFIVRLKEDENLKNFVGFVESLPDIYRVDYHEGSFDFALSVTNWVNIISAGLAVLLGALSLFLISNTVRLAMASRSDEVMIMKFIGATEGRIKLPFILEGITIGAAGAVFASLLIGFIYNRLFTWFSLQGSDEVFLSGIKLVGVRETIMMVFIVFFGLGILLGMFGSLLAIRKHLKV